MVNCIAHEKALYDGHCVAAVAAVPEYVNDAGDTVPAVAAVEGMLAQRGMSASTVGRDALFNAIIQSAMPLAQSNAQAIQQSVSQQNTYVFLRIVNIQMCYSVAVCFI